MKENNLGVLDLKWRGVYGDAGNLRVGPYKSESLPISHFQNRDQKVDITLQMP